MHHLSRLKNAPSEFSNISINHNMTPGERSREKKFYLKAKELIIVQTFQKMSFM